MYSHNCQIILPDNVRKAQFNHSIPSCLLTIEISLCELMFVKALLVFSDPSIFKYRTSAFLKNSLIE
jgi:hypothetical protein